MPGGIAYAISYAAYQRQTLLRVFGSVSWRIGIGVWRHGAMARDRKWW
jgi:hypothetical protein